MLPAKRAFRFVAANKTMACDPVMSFFLTTKRRREALLLGDHLKPMNLNLGKQPLRIRRKFLSSFAVQMSFAGNFVVEGVEDYIYSRLTFVFRRVPRQRSSFSSYQLGLPV